MSRKKKATAPTFELTRQFEDAYRYYGSELAIAKPRAAAPMIEPPQHLDEQARGKWVEAWEIIADRDEIDQGVLDALAGYCVAYSRWTAAEAKVNELGSVVRSPAGFPTENPYCKVAASASRQMRQWLAQLRKR